MDGFELYIVDVETSGLKSNCDILELSIYRLSTNEQKTWCLKALNEDAIEDGALRVNGHKKEDILWKTASGKEKYQEPNKVIAEVENWISDDMLPASNRILCGHNVAFDKNMMSNLWDRCGSMETFPFSKYSLDTMQIEFMFDYVNGKPSEAYSLSALTKKYGIKNEKAHTAAADVAATVKLFEKQVERYKKLINV